MTVLPPPNRPALRYPGGKWVDGKWILSHFPQHTHYIEAFAGGASLLMRKPRSYFEMINDQDEEVINLFRVLQNRETAEELERILRVTPYARSEYEISFALTDDPIERARRLIIRSFLGFAVGSATKSQHCRSFRNPMNFKDRNPTREWSTYPDHLKRFTERLKGVVIESGDAFEIISEVKKTKTLLFLDPPYREEDRTNPKTHGYRFEMSEEDHKRLIDTILTVDALIIICGYDNPIYQRLNQAGWTQAIRDTRAVSNAHRQECLWINPQCVAANSSPMGQLDLFNQQ